MHVIANRVRLGWGAWLQVIDRIPLYMAEFEMPPMEHPSIWEPAFVKLLHVVEGIYDGSVPDLSKGALYFADLNHIERPWFKELISAQNPETGLRQHPSVSNINGLTFFK